MDSILDALGYIGSALDKPGRAVRGLLAGNAREGLAAVPFSDSLGLTDESQRTSGTDLLKALGVDTGGGTLGDVAGMGVEAATDPLSYLGLGLGARLGGRAAEAALARGPRYATTAEDLGRMAGNADVPEMLKAWGGSGADVGRLASEINPGSRFLGSGAEGMAFASPEGRVTRLGSVPGGSQGRPVADGVLQADRAVDVPMGRNAVRVENTPLAHGVGNEAVLNTPDAFGATRMGQLDQTLDAGGLINADRKAENVGMVGGYPQVIDPGAIDDTFFKGRYQPVRQSADPGALMRMLIGLGGGDDAVRRAIEAGGRPNFGASLGAMGGTGGAATGVLSRIMGGQR